MRITLIITLTAILLSGCTINKDLLFKSPPDMVYSDPSKITVSDYRIAPNDELRFQLFPNSGERLLSATTGVTVTNSISTISPQQLTNSFRVEPNGLVELPELGYIKVLGLTLEEAESLLEEEYSSIYHEPFILLSVTNNRVLVFPGGAGKAEVITLVNQNTTVLEALALAGGIQSRGIASEVKLIRKTDTGHEVFILDLSIMAGIELSSIKVQANDVIYVSSNPNIASGILQDFSPIVSILSSLSLLYIIIAGL